MVHMSKMLDGAVSVNAVMEYTMKPYRNVKEFAFRGLFLEQQAYLWGEEFSSFS